MAGVISSIHDETIEAAEISECVFGSQRWTAGRGITLCVGFGACSGGCGIHQGIG